MNGEMSRADGEQKRAHPTRGDSSGHDGGLADLIGVLERAGIAYWIDSGVLLGLVRSGGINPWEKDIDLAIVGDQLDAVLDVMGDFESAGYRVNVNRYRGTVFSIGLKPCEQRSAEDLRAAIHVYYETGEYLWSPQVQLYVPPPAPDVYRGHRSLTGDFLRRSIERWFYTGAVPLSAERASRAPDRCTIPYRLARWVYRHVDRGVLAEIWPIREIYVPMTWLLPVRLVLPIGRRVVSGATYPVPVAAEEYLTFRYGDWRTPVESWCYWEDDGAIVREPPLRLRQQILAEGALQCKR